MGWLEYFEGIEHQKFLSVLFNFPIAKTLNILCEFLILYFVNYDGCVLHFLLFTFSNEQIDLC